MESRCSSQQKMNNEDHYTACRCRKPSDKQLAVSTTSRDWSAAINVEKCDTCSVHPRPDKLLAGGNTLLVSGERMSACRCWKNEWGNGARFIKAVGCAGHARSATRGCEGFIAHTGRGKERMAQLRQTRKQSHSHCSASRNIRAGL